MRRASRNAVVFVVVALAVGFLWQLPAGAQFPGLDKVLKVAEAQREWTPAEEQLIGEATAAKLVAVFGLYENPAMVEYVNLVGQSVAQYAARQDITYRFAILDTELLNAFACPAGYIFVTRGLLANAGDEAELAGVLAHEVVHAAEKHVEKELRSRKMAGIGMEIGTEQAVSSTGGVAGLAMEQALKVAEKVVDQLLTGKLSRDKEYDADNKGLALAAAVGYDPQAYLEFLNWLGQASTGADNRRFLGNLTASHPSYSDRVKRLNDLIGQRGWAGQEWARVAERYQASADFAAPPSATEAAAATAPAMESIAPTPAAAVPASQAGSPSRPGGATMVSAAREGGQSYGTITYIETGERGQEEKGEGRTLTSKLLFRREGQINISQHGHDAPDLQKQTIVRMFSGRGQSARVETQYDEDYQTTDTCGEGGGSFTVKRRSGWHAGGQAEQSESSVLIHLLPGGDYEIEISLLPVDYSGESALEESISAGCGEKAKHRTEKAAVKFSSQGERLKLRGKLNAANPNLLQGSQSFPAKAGELSGHSPGGLPTTLTVNWQLTTPPVDAYWTTSAGREDTAGLELRPFSADMIATDGKERHRMKVYSKKNAFRMEMSEGGEQTISIMRYDRRVTWMLMPSEKIYMETPIRAGQSLGEAAQDPEAKVESEVLGTEKVGAYTCIKSRVRVTSRGETFSGLQWAAQELGGFVVKIVDEKSGATVEYENIKLGEPDPKLFEVPAGYSKMQMPGMGPR